MITVYRNPRKTELTDMTIDELWECIDCLKLWKYVDCLKIKTRTRLIKLIEEVCSDRLTSLLHRISIGSYENSQTLWIDCPEFKHQYNSLKKVADCGWYEIGSNTQNSIEFLYNKEEDYTDMDDDIQCIWNNQNVSGYNAKLDKMDEVTIAITFLETRELYVKLRYLFIDDICNYCIKLFCNLLTNIIIK